MGAIERQSVEVDVTPVFGNGSVCEIEPGNGPSHAFVKGGIIRLRGNPSFQVAFQLQPGDPADLQFDTSDPIWSLKSQCPGSSCKDPQVTIVSCTPTVLTVDVDPEPQQNDVHVSLGFSNGVRCDPIIING